jgi:hypothetical protein
MNPLQPPQISMYANPTPPKTPPGFAEEGQILFHNWPEPETFPEDEYPDVTLFGSFEERKFVDTSESDQIDFDVTHQDVLLLHAPKERYAHTRKQPVPKLHNEREMLVQVHVVGLNPLDWKAPDFGFGLPS